MQISYLAMADLFCRFAAVGMLLLLCIFYLSKRTTLRSVLGTCFSIGLIGFILLTAPIADHHYGVLRGVFLVLTETVPYVLWAWSMSLLDDHFKPQRWAFWRYIAIGAALIWFVYFFGINQGKGVMHDVNHAVEAVVLMHILFYTLYGFNDDLVDKRRTTRKALLLGVTSYLVLIVTLELADASIRDNHWFSFYHALFILLAIIAFGFHAFRDTFSDKAVKVDEPLDSDSNNGNRQIDAVESNEQPIPSVFVRDHQRLITLMEEGVYRESGLTVRALAHKLALPEHQLRVLINQHMGYRNFSDFLNSYRVPAACEQLVDNELLRKPILTIALELGYGSVGPFNRAFKLQTGKTPKEYRQQFQK